MCNKTRRLSSHKIFEFVASLVQASKGWCMYLNIQSYTKGLNQLLLACVKFFGESWVRKFHRFGHKLLLENSMNISNIYKCSNYTRRLSNQRISQEEVQATKSYGGIAPASRYFATLKQESAQGSNYNILDLPLEMLQAILFKLDLKDLLNSSLVNTIFNAIIGVNGLNYYKSLLGIIQVDIEDRAALSAVKAKFYTWLKNSPSSPFRARLLACIYLLEHPYERTHLSRSQSRLLDAFYTPTVELVYSSCGFAQWLYNNGIVLAKDEVATLKIIPENIFSQARLNLSVRNKIFSLLNIDPNKVAPQKPLKLGHFLCKICYLVIVVLLGLMPFSILLNFRFQ